jgi:hypothetical protein
MTTIERENLIHLLSKTLTDCADLDILIEAFYNNNIEYFNTLDDEWLLEEAKDLNLIA